MSRRYARIKDNGGYSPLGVRKSVTPTSTVVATILLVGATALAITFIILYATKPAPGPVGEIDAFTKCRHPVEFLETKELFNDHFRQYFPQDWIYNDGIIIPDRPDLLVKWSNYTVDGLVAWNASRETARTLLADSTIEGLSEEERHALYTLGTTDFWYWEDPLKITVDPSFNYDHMCDYYWGMTRDFAYGTGDPGAFNVVVDLVGLDLGIEHANNFADSMITYLDYLERSAANDLVWPHITLPTMLDTCFQAGELDQPDVLLTSAYEPYLTGTASQQTAAAAAYTRARVELQKLVDLLTPGSAYEIKSLALRPDAGSPGLGYGPQFAKDVYIRNLKSIGGTQKTPAEIHAQGLALTAEIEQEFVDLVNIWIDPTIATFTEHIDKLVSNSTYAEIFRETKTVAEYIQEYKDGILESSEAIPSVFQHFPRTIAKVDAFRGFGSPTYGLFSVVVPDGTGSVIHGVDYLNLPVPQTQPGPLNMSAIVDVQRGILLANAFHEAYPGHGLQIPISRELPCSIRPGTSAGSGEGWALYAEKVAAIDMGLAFPVTEDNLFIHLSYLQNRLLRAKRFVIDTGLHDFGWSYQQAVDAVYYIYGELPYAESEAERYIIWPGQAIGYLIGSIGIEEVRAEAETALGPDFDLKVFHDFMIRYHTPDEVIARERAEYYIELVQAGTLDDVWPPQAPQPERELLDITTRSGIHKTDYAMKYAMIKSKVMENGGKAIVRTKHKNRL